MRREPETPVVSPEHTVVVTLPNGKSKTYILTSVTCTDSGVLSLRHEESKFFMAYAPAAWSDVTVD